MMSKIKIIYTENNSILDKRVKASIKKKNLINEYIRENKNLKKLNDKGIKFRMPV